MWTTITTHQFNGTPSINLCWKLWTYLMRMDTKDYYKTMFELRFWQRWLWRVRSPELKCRISPPSSGSECKPSKTPTERDCKLSWVTSASFLLDSLIDPEDGGDLYLWNIRLSLNYKPEDRALYQCRSVCRSLKPK